MSVVIASVDNDYEEALGNSYQLLKNDNNTYSIYVAMSILSGYFLGEGCEGRYEFDSFEEAWKEFCGVVNQEEYFE